VTLDQERLFAESAFGRRVTAAVEEAARRLTAENRALEAELVTEERALTEARPTTPPEQFRSLADAFDARVEGIRAAQEAKSRAIAAYRDAERQRFLEVALPILAQVVFEAGAVAVLDTRAIVLSIDEIDITDRVLARLDAELGDGSGPEEPPLWPDDPSIPPLAPVRPMPRPSAPAGPPLDLPQPGAQTGGAAD
jgi:Skp family chaperone for outer membrane proteins